MSMSVKRLPSDQYVAKFASVNHRAGTCSITFEKRLSTTTISNKHLEYLEACAADYLAQHMNGGETPMLQKIDTDVFDIRFSSLIKK